MKPVAKKRKDAFRSAADIEEQEAFEKRNFQIKVMLIAGIPAVIALLFFIYMFSTPPVYVD
jgi:hypothetical protein